jgi:hypothetical protein
MPIPEDVRDFLGDLLGKPVSVTKTGELDYKEEPEQFVTGLEVRTRIRCGDRASPTSPSPPPPAPRWP